MARTNPVFVTAKTAVYLMAQAEIPDAERIVRSLKIENKEPLQDLSGSSVILGNALAVEAKYRTLCSLIMNSSYRTCVSLCGRLDSITAPELLLEWEKEKTATNIERAIVDCERLKYISSAGRCSRAADHAGKDEVRRNADSCQSVCEKTFGTK